MIKARPITVSEAASQLGVSPQRVRQVIAEGRLDALKVNSRLYLINPRDLARYAKTVRPQGRPPRK